MLPPFSRRPNRAKFDALVNGEKKSVGYVGRL
jgi:hypothetical protein